MDKFCFRFFLLISWAQITWNQSCPPLEPPLYGSFFGICSNSLGSNCYVQCNPNFDRLGPCSLTCQPNGQWTVAKVLCLNRNIECPPLPLLEGIRLGGPCFNFAGGICHFSCDPGFILSGSDSIYCTNSGSWSAPTPSCIAQGCPALSPPLNGQITGNCGQRETLSGITQGSECYFTCNPGYTLIGSNRTTCLGQPGKWDQPVPICQLIPCKPLELIGFDSISGPCSEPILNGVCTASCPKGSRPEGEPKWVCTANGWVSSFVRCISIRCPSLDPIPNGAMIGACRDSVKPADNCSFSCNQGYALVGQSLLTCQVNGKYDFKPPECILISCPNLTSTSVNLEGQCSGINLGPGSICRFSCQPCQTLIGSSQVICETNGRWNDTIPTCQPMMCPSIKGILNGLTMEDCSQSTCQGICNFRCNPGYLLTGQSSLICQSNGQWNGQVPSCVPEPTCPPLATPANAITSGICQGAKAGAICEFVCSQCYTPIGSTRVTCLSNGVWNEPLGSCRPLTCPIPTFDLQLTGQGVCSNAKCGDVCTFRCVNGYLIQGSSQLTCDYNGRWDRPFPRCIQIRCPPVIAPQNGQLSVECINASPGSRCSVTCAQGYQPIGLTSVLCQLDGSWSSNPIFACQLLKCTDWPVPKGGLFINECPEGLNCPTLCPGQPGQRCNLRCGAGYRLIGTTEEVTCLAETLQWSRPLPTCEPIR